MDQVVELTCELKHIVKLQVNTFPRISSLLLFQLFLSSCERQHLAGTQGRIAMEKCINLSIFAFVQTCAWVLATGTGLTSGLNQALIDSGTHRAPMQAPAAGILQTSYTQVIG